MWIIPLIISLFLGKAFAGIVDQGLIKGNGTTTDVTSRQLLVNPEKTLCPGREHENATKWPANIRVHYTPDEFFSAANESAGTKNSGFLVDILNSLEGATGSNFTITSRPDLAYGRPNDNGTWDGTLIGALINGEADLVGPGLTITSYGDKVVDYSVPILPYKLFLVYNLKYGLDNMTQYITLDDENFIYFNSSKNSTLQAIYRRMKAAGNASFVGSNAEGIAKVLHGNFAYIESEPFVRHAMNVHGMTLATEEVGKYFSFAFAVQKGWPFLQQLNTELLKLSEDGTLSKLIDKYNLANPVVVILR
ncbi:hypothetical protein BV898_15523 [Hypsibius exemplaris]|uniref:Ionotropic glutamate receptor C-terminal domain-containing protein n=1 Tax=Hypsibius exemplaris TaxID=2072580 RepID=A0A9X6RKT2_HYPEX|nr:hypothetical protein BV898_15523 [Hypsibius exemplaris]